jgi:hypothetical protein
LNGCAVPGAVEVDGGIEKVRVPREPEDMPPPTRASAADMASVEASAKDSATAAARIMPRTGRVNLMVESSKPRMGKCL